MVQAAAQAQAVVAAAKSRGDGLVPMTSSQITALSQIQAQAIVHARKTNGTPQQIQTQIQLQAQALVHAHTQAQIAAGIYKGGGSSSASAPASKKEPTVAVFASGPAPPLTSPQLQQQQQMTERHARELDNMKKTHATMTSITEDQKRDELTGLKGSHKEQLLELHATFRKQNAAAEYAGAKAPPVPNPTAALPGLESEPTPSATSPQFLAKLSNTLNTFWAEQLHLVQQLPPSTEQDFKTHNDLPLARIKRIMKSDEDVRMISAEAPVLFAKACELFILELTLRSWSFSQHHKRRTLQKEDIREAIQRTDIFDFLVDVIQ